MKRDVDRKVELLKSFNPLLDKWRYLVFLTFLPDSSKY